MGCQGLRASARLARHSTSSPLARLARMARSFPRSLAAVAVAGVLLVTGCSDSDDDSDNGSGTPTAQSGPSRDSSVEPREEYAEYCDAYEATFDEDLTDLEMAERQLEVAPEELKADLELVKKWVELRDGDAEADPAALAEAEAEGVPAVVRVATTLNEECGITVPLL